MCQIDHEGVIQNEETVVRCAQMLNKLNLIVAIIHKELIEQRCGGSVL